MYRSETRHSATILTILSSSQIPRSVFVTARSGFFVITTAFVTSYPKQIRGRSRAEDHSQPLPVGSSSSCSVEILGPISNSISSVQIAGLFL